MTSRYESAPRNFKLVNSDGVSYLRVETGYVGSYELIYRVSEVSEFENLHSDLKIYVLYKDQNFPPETKGST